MDEKLKNKIIKNVDYSKLKKSLKKYDGMEGDKLEEEKLYLKIAIETEKKYNREFFFTMIALIVATISIALTSVGNLVTTTDKLVSLTEKLGLLDQEMLPLYNEAVLLNAKMLSSSINYNKIYLALIIIILSLALYLFIIHLNKCIQCGTRLATYEFELKYIDELILKESKKQTLETGIDNDKNKENERHITGSGIILISLIAFFLIRDKNS